MTRALTEIRNADAWPPRDGRARVRLEAAAEAYLSEDAARRMIRAARLPVRRSGRLVFVEVAALKAAKGRP